MKMFRFVNKVFVVAITFFGCDVSNVKCVSINN